MRVMRSRKTERIANNMISLFPVVYRKILRVEHLRLGMRPTRCQLPILAILTNRGPLPISEIGNRLSISKPQMTALIGKLIKEGKVERLPDERDRRVIRIAITKQGRGFFHEGRRLAKEGLMKNMKGLSAGDIDKLHASLENIVHIVSKMREEGD
jgi:DNA-binding MarR family transcriptional regulator